jgi:hypothetical protein
VAELPSDQVVTTIRSVLGTISASLGSKELGAEKLADLKSGIDEVRLRLWGALSAVNAEDHAAFVTRFRLRRATEICEAISEDLVAGHLDRSHDALAELARASRNLANLITAGTPTPRKAR